MSIAWCRLGSARTAERPGLLRLAQLRRVAIPLALFVFARSAGAGEQLFVSEGNRLRVLSIDDLDEPTTEARVLIENARLDPDRGRDINGPICPVPEIDGLIRDGSAGHFVSGEDTGQPERPAGWGVHSVDGHQVGKLAALSAARQPEPYGCAFDADGRLFTTDLGDPGFGNRNGRLILWFPPYDRFPGSPGSYPDTTERSDGYCVLADDLGTAGAIAVDDGGHVYVAASSDMEILRFSPPFPTGPDAAGGCGGRDGLGAPMADRVARERFTGARWWSGLITYSGLAFGRDGHLYAASVATGRIGEFAPDGSLVRTILVPAGWWPPYGTGTPQGLAVDGEGTLYYADLDLRFGDWTLRPGPEGKVWRIRFDARGEPLAPEVVLDGLAFPDGLGVLRGGGDGVAGD